MNVVFFMQDTGAVFGAERATLDLAAGLREAGDQPRFFLIEEMRLGGNPSGLRASIEAEGFPVDLFPVQGRISRDLARRVRTRFAEIKGDVLHVIGYKANLHAWLSGIHPVVATVHGWLFRSDVKERLYDAIDRWCLRRCDHVVCLSSYYEQLLLDSGIGQDRLTRIPSGLRSIPTPAQVQSAARSGAPVTFGMMGRFSEEKNHRMFLDAARIVLSDNPDVRFVIAGQGPLESSVKDAAEKAGLTGSVQFTGYTDVDHFMRSIDVYVICSNMENLPYSILEAMAWSRPVIGTSVGGIPDLVDHGHTGRLVPLRHAEALAGAMTEFVAAPGSILAMGVNGRNRLEQRFSISVSVERHRQLYRSLGG